MEATTNTSEALVFDAKAIAPLALFMARNDIRYYLNGMYVSPHPQGGVYIAATDGHRLAVWRDPQGHCDQPRILAISPELIAAAKKKHKAEVPFHDKRISYENGRLVLAQWNTTDGKAKDGWTPTALIELHIQPGKADIDGTYPNMWRVIPKEEDLVPVLHGHMQAQYLKDLGAVSALLGGGKQSWMWHFSTGAGGNGAVLTRFSAADNFMVITMPCRGHSSASGPLPDCFVRPAIIPDDPTAPRKPAA